MKKPASSDAGFFVGLCRPFRGLARSHRYCTAPESGAILWERASPRKGRPGNAKTAGKKKGRRPSAPQAVKHTTNSVGVQQRHRLRTARFDPRPVAVLDPAAVEHPGAPHAHHI